MLTGDNNIGKKVEIPESKLKELLGYAERKKELLENIYDITSRRSFQGDESEIDEFMEYLDIREPYYEQLSELNSEGGDAFRNFEIDFDNENRLYKEVSQLLSNARDVGALIVELDRRNNENMQKVYDRLSAEIVKINASRKARSSYNFFQAQSGNYQ